MSANHYPRDWAVRPLKELVSQFLNGGTPSTSNSDYWGGNIPWITGADAENSITVSARKHVTERGVRESSTNIVPKGNILLVTRTGVGKVSIAGVDVAISQDLTGLVLDSQTVDAQYLYRQLFRLGPALQRMTQGTIIQGIQREEVEALTIPCPPLPEQRRIAEILDTIDAAIQQTDALIAKLKQMKAGLLHDLLTRGLDENGELRDPLAHPEQFKDSPLGRIPREWEVTTLGRVVSEAQGLIQTGPFGSQLHAHEYVQSGVPVIMPQDILDGYVSEENMANITPGKARELARHILALNDVVLARRGDLSRCAFIGERETGWLCGTGCMLVRLPEDEVDGRWLTMVYQHDQCQRQILGRAVGSTMVNLNTSLLTGLRMAKPPHEEQLAIIDVVNAHSSRIHAEEAYHETLKQMKQGLMDDLLTGRVRTEGGQRMGSG